MTLLLRRNAAVAIGGPVSGPRGRSSTEVSAVGIAQRPAIDQDAIPPPLEGVHQHRVTGVQNPDGGSAATATASDVDPRPGVAP